MTDQGFQLRRAICETAVADDHDHGLRRCSHLGADRERQVSGDRQRSRSRMMRSIRRMAVAHERICLLLRRCAVPLPYAATRATTGRVEPKPRAVRVPSPIDRRPDAPLHSSCRSRRIDVDMNDARRRRNRPPRVSAILIRAGSEQKHDVRFSEHRSDMASERARSRQCAEHSRGQRVTFIGGAFAHLCGQDPGKCAASCSAARAGAAPEDSTPPPAKTIGARLKQRQVI